MNHELVYNRILSETGLDPRGPKMGKDDLKLIEQHCGTDFNKLSCLVKRRLSGEPMAYVLGRLYFGDLELLIDKRVYITDPEAIWLVKEMVRRLTSEKDSKEVLEVGTGCGSLCLAVYKQVNRHNYTAVDIDIQALDVARENARIHQMDIQFYVSDYFFGLPEHYTPDIIFADPPWGTEESIYDDDRPADHYLAMPGISVWPFKSITGIHEQIIERILEKGWNCELYMNFGMLGLDEINKALEKAAKVVFLNPVKNVTIAHIRFGGF
ncbi:MAG: class I SAM-dependent methyltransferase [Balneolales bacterium]|nr:class I SAM-dependent methyltransferase [Balneolales bacterium]